MIGRHSIICLFLAAALALVPIACSDESSGPLAETIQQNESPPALLADSPVEASSATEETGSQTIEPWQMEESFVSDELTIAFRTRCLEKGEASPECPFLRKLVVVEMTMALEEIERARDQRGTAEALEALSLSDEPEIQVAALRIPGQFPDSPGIAERVVPLMLESAYLQVQQLAALVLGSNPDPTLAAVGAYWGTNHGTLYAEDSWQEYPDFAPHYAGMGFPDYPGAEWFSPADSDRSVGWWTTDDFTTVSSWLTEALGTQGLDYQGWAERLSQESIWNAQIDPDKEAEVQRLIEEWTKTQDMAALEKMQKLQEEMYAPMQAASEIADQGVDSLGPPNITEAQEQVRFFIAEERAGHVARLVIAYPLTSLGHTVIQHSWNLVDYPSAWPPAEEDSNQDQ